jgi:hypothetical protein
LSVGQGISPRDDRNLLGHNDFAGDPVQQVHGELVGPGRRRSQEHVIALGSAEIDDAGPQGASGGNWPCRRRRAGRVAEGPSVVGYQLGHGNTSWSPGGPDGPPTTSPNRRRLRTGPEIVRERESKVAPPSRRRGSRNGAHKTYGKLGLQSGLGVAFLDPAMPTPDGSAARGPVQAQVQKARRSSCGTRPQGAGREPVRRGPQGIRPWPWRQAVPRRCRRGFPVRQRNRPADLWPQAPVP